MTPREAATEIIQTTSAANDYEWAEEVARVIEVYVAQEREACAKIAETTYAHSAFHFELATAVATAIRARNTSQG